MHKFDFIAFVILILIIIVFIIVKLYEYFNSNDVNKKINEILNKEENFIVSDAQDIHNYKYLKEMVEHKKDNFNKDTLNNPPVDDKVDYDMKINNNEFPIKIDEKKDKNSYISVVDFGWDSPFPYVSCSNDSIDSKYKTGKEKVKPYKVSCGFPKNVNSQNFYKNNYKAQSANLEDYLVRGANYANYSDYVHPSKSDFWILSQNTKGLPPDQTKYRNIPTGRNYAFYGSPSMRLPS